MKGELAYFVVDDEIVGGCIRWKSYISISKSYGNEYEVSKRWVITGKYWFKRKVSECVIRLCWLRGGKELEADRFKVAVPDVPVGDLVEEILKLERING